jgi:hypothetical protein
MYKQKSTRRFGIIMRVNWFLVLILLATERRVEASHRDQMSFGMQATARNQLAALQQGSLYSGYFSSAQGDFGPSRYGQPQITTQTYTTPAYPAVSSHAYSHVTGRLEHVEGPIHPDHVANTQPSNLSQVGGAYTHITKNADGSWAYTHETGVSEVFGGMGRAIQSIPSWAVNVIGSWITK